MSSRVCSTRVTTQNGLLGHYLVVTARLPGDVCQSYYHVETVCIDVYYGEDSTCDTIAQPSATAASCAAAEACRTAKPPRWVGSREHRDQQEQCGHNP